MAAIAGAVFCELPSQRTAAPSRPRLSDPSVATGGKIVLQPRLCTLRMYGSGGDREATLVRAPRGGDDDGRSSAFFASLADYVDTARKSHDFEIISGRLAMIVFAAAVSVEAATGSSLFKKLDVQEIGEAAGVCAAVVATAAAFAWASSTRDRIGRMLFLGCNAFVDYLIDSVVDALFADAELFEWTDKI